MNKRQAKKRNKKFYYKKWSDANFKEYLKKASKTRHATLKFLPEEFWAIEEEV